MNKTATQETDNGSAVAPSLLNVGLAPAYTLTKSQEIAPNIVFHCGAESGEVMRLDKDGMTYKGQRIEDGGEAHKAFMEVMGMMKANV